MRSVCEPIFQKPLKDISFGLLLLQLFRTASRFNMEVQPSLVLLQKTLLNIEGLGKQLYPDLDLWDNALPFLEKWQQERLSPFANLKKVGEKIPEWLEALPEIPELVYETMQELKYLQRNREQQEIEKSLQKARQNEKRIVRNTYLGLALLAAAAVSLQPGIANFLADVSAATLILAAAGIALLLFRK